MLFPSELNIEELGIFPSVMDSNDIYHGISQPMQPSSSAKNCFSGHAPQVAPVRPPLQAPGRPPGQADSGQRYLRRELHHRKRVKNHGDIYNW